LQIDFKRFIDFYGLPGARHQFQNACYSLLKRKFNENVHKIRENPGDEGIDVYVGEFSEPIDVFQCKFFIDNISYQQINDSFDRAIANTKYKVKSWTLMLPKDLDIKETLKWTKWKQEREAKFQIKIHLADQSGIIDELKQFNLYNEIFQLTEKIMLEDIFKKVTVLSDPKQNTYVSFIVEKMSNYLTLRIEVFKELFYNSYDIQEYFRQLKIRSFHEMFQQAEIKAKFLFSQIDSVLNKLEEADYPLAYMCRQYIFMEKVYIDQIEQDLHYADEYLFNLKSYIFQVSLRKIIWSLEQEAHEINRFLLQNTEHGINNRVLSEFDMRDTIVAYKDQSDLWTRLAAHIISLKHRFNHESFEFFYRKEDTEAIAFELIFPNTIFSNSKTPYPTSMSKMIDYIKHRNTKFNEAGEFTFHLYSCNIVLLEELDDKTIEKLSKIKNTANIKYHYFIKENRLERYARKLASLNIEVKTIHLDDYQEAIQKYSKEIELLTNNPSKKLSEALITGVLMDGSIITTNENGFVIRKRKK
jgi:hypothetical protein